MDSAPWNKAYRFNCAVLVGMVKTACV